MLSWQLESKPMNPRFCDEVVGDVRFWPVSESPDRDRERAHDLEQSF